MSSNVTPFPADQLAGRLHRGRIPMLAILLAMSVASMLAAFLLRFDFRIAVEHQRLIWITLPLLLVTRWFGFLLFRLDLRPLRHASPADLIPAAGAITLGTLMFGFVVKGLIPDLYYSRSVVMIDWFLLQLMLFAVYAGVMVYREAWSRSHAASRKVLLVGEGSSLLVVLREIRSSARWLPVGVICGSTARPGEKLLDVTVQGGFESMIDAARRAGADLVCFARPGLNNRRLLGLAAECRAHNVDFVVRRGNACVPEAREREEDFNVEMILQREQAAVDLTAVRELIQGRKVLVTGAGGSIGSELCRQIAAFRPASLALVDRSENNLFFIHRELSLQYPDLAVRPLLVDITDDGAVCREFQAIRPEIVFHAAAHKHVGMMERWPREALRNNVIGTANVAQAAASTGAQAFINISTDKAVRPKSYMGLSKRLAEMCVEEMNRLHATRFVTVRFGNVAGSNGSVVQLFRQQIAQGGPVTVSDPRAQRFFLSITEAVQLVLQAAVLSEAGGVFVLDMKEPIEIYELAKTMISLAGYLPHEDIPIEFTRLGAGEKLTEELQDDHEQIHRTMHERILMIRRDTGAGSLGILDLIPRWRKLLQKADVAELVEELARFWPGRVSLPVGVLPVAAARRSNGNGRHTAPSGESRLS